MFQRLIFPLSREPPKIGIGAPELPCPDRPMRREKNSSICCGAPNWKVDAFSRKNERFSGKNRSKRVRFTCSSSTSTCAKSVLTVKSAVRLGRTAHLASTPTLASPVERVARHAEVLVGRPEHVRDEAQLTLRSAG